MESKVNVFDEMGAAWAEIADEHQTQQQIQFLKSYLKTDGYILDLACGTGRHSIPLSKQGYHMVGLDVSERLLTIAKQRSLSPQLIKADIRHLPFIANSFASAISMDTSLGYLASEKEDEDSIAQARRVLVRFGTLIVDVFNRTSLVEKYSGKKPSARTFDYPSFTLQQKRTVSDNGNWLCDSWSIAKKADGQVRVFEHRVRLYTQSRLQRLLQNTGFKVTQTYGDYEGQPFSDSSSRLIVIAEAN
jgi:ubiquinone/menaquinone biosynthesis C-methylase UbiE